MFGIGHVTINPSLHPNQTKTCRRQKDDITDIKYDITMHLKRNIHININGTIYMREYHDSHIRHEKF